MTFPNSKWIEANLTFNLYRAGRTVNFFGVGISINLASILSTTVCRFHCLDPIASMYGTFTYIYHQKKQPNVGKYTVRLLGSLVAVIFPTKKGILWKVPTSICTSQAHLLQDFNHQPGAFNTNQYDSETIQTFVDHVPIQEDPLKFLWGTDMVWQNKTCRMKLYAVMKVNVQFPKAR